MSNKLCLVLSVILAATMLLAACAYTAPVQPATSPAVSTEAVQPMTAPAATTAPVRPTTAPGDIPQGGDLCGGTGGNGQIVSVGNNEFTMKRNDGRDMVVRLAGQATIKTSADPAPLSDLKIGWRVTLVGGRNPDGSFTADMVVVCNGLVP
jgi:hypothetical protein